MSLQSSIDNVHTSRTRNPNRGARRDIPFGKPMIGDAEREAVSRVLSGNCLTQGPNLARFEAVFAAYTGAPHAVATSSCAAALHLAFMSLGIGTGDEVLVSAQTHVATAHAVELCGARCIFVDSEPTTGNIDPKMIDRNVTVKTKAIAVVHYAGIPADMESINATARKYQLSVVEDCALALGARIQGRHVGLWGDVGCFSFYPAKHITTGEGGMLVTRHSHIAEDVACRRAFGVVRKAEDVVVPEPLYDVPFLGTNCRMTEFAAAIGAEQMRRLPAFLDARRRNFEVLAEALSNISDIRVVSDERPERESAFYCLVCTLEGRLCSQRDSLAVGLAGSGVASSVYYPHPVPRLKYYCRNDVYDKQRYPVATRLSDSSIALPVGPHIGSADIQYIESRIAHAMEKVEV